MAEDNPVNQNLLVRVLERRGMQVVTVENGRDAVEIWKAAGPFDLVLMDIQMPVLDGNQATREIRALEKPAGRHTPILACTANVMAEDIRIGVAAGIDGYVAKPIRISTLFAALAKVLGDGSGFPANKPPETAPALPQPQNRA